MNVHCRLVSLRKPCYGEESLGSDRDETTRSGRGRMHSIRGEVEFAGAVFA